MHDNYSFEALKKNTDIIRSILKKIIDAHDDKEPFCELGEFDVILLEDYYPYLTIKYFILAEHEDEKYRRMEAWGQEIGFEVKIKRGQIRKLKSIYAALEL